MHSSTLSAVLKLSVKQMYVFFDVKNIVDSYTTYCTLLKKMDVTYILNQSLFNEMHIITFSSVLTYLVVILKQIFHSEQSFNISES